MAIGKDRAFGRQLRTLLHVGAIGDLSDGQLLERFATDRGEGAELAFAALVDRHGPMVLRVCRSVLDDPHDSQDAFQATFLVLVTKGRSLWVRDSLGPWLHQVAQRTARCARSNASRRQRLERRASEIRGESASLSPAEPTDEVERALLEEIDRLPERFKAPVVLCDLEGQTHEAAARALGWPIGTVKSRQARARDRLRDQLTRRGFAPNHGLAILALPKVSAALPSVLVDSTAVLAARFVGSRAIAPGSAAGLAQEVLRAMITLRTVKIASLLFALGAAGSGAGLMAGGSGEPAPNSEANPPLVGIKPQDPAASPPLDNSVYPVKPGRFEVTETAVGSLEPSRSVDIRSQVQALLTIISLKPDGSRVKKGEVIAELDTAHLRDLLVSQRVATQQAEATFKQARLVREVAEFAVKEYVEGILPADKSRLKGKIADAERALKEGDARLERTKVARKKLDEMFAATKGPTTPTDIVADLNINDLIESAGRNLSERKQSLELEKQQLDQLERFTAVIRTRKLEIDVEQAKRDEFAKLTLWDQARDQLAIIEHQIQLCSIFAPTDGLLTLANDQKSRLANGVDIKEGAKVQSNTILARIIDVDSPMLVNVKVREAVVDQIQPGQKTLVKIEAARGLTFTGTVLEVAPKLDGPSFDPKKGKVYTTRIKLDQVLRNQMPEMSARATILIRELDHVLSVPLACLEPTDQGGFRVSVKTPEGTIEKRHVTLGIANDEFVEIKDGLKAGDLVDLNRRVPIPNPRP